MGQKPRILYLMHCYHNRAGTEEHTRTLASELSDSFETFIMAPEQGRLLLMHQGREIIGLPVPEMPFPLAPYRSMEFETAVDRIMRQVRPDLVHVQHFFNLPLGILDQLASYRRPLCISFHDYYAVTPHFTMEGTGNPLLVTQPQYSIRLFGRDLSVQLRQRQEVIERSLAHFRHRIVPSRYLASVLSQIYPSEYRVIPHGIAPFSATRHLFDPENPVLGFVGSLLPQKGFVHLGPVFTRLRAEFPGLKLHVFGGGVLAQLLVPEGMIMHGAYVPEDLPEVMSQIDLGIIPSTFAETFSLVLSEFWQAGVPVICSRIGALAERIRDGQNGALFEPGNQDDLYRVLREVVAGRSWEKWKIQRPRQIAEMLEDYRDLYRSMLSEK